MEKQNKPRIDCSSHTTTAQESDNVPEVKYDDALSIDVVRSKAIQSKKFNNREQESHDDNCNNQDLNSSVSQRGSPTGRIIKYDDVCNIQDPKSGATYQNKFERNAAEKYDDVCNAESIKTRTTQLEGNVTKAINKNDSGCINNPSLTVTLPRNNPRKSGVKKVCHNNNSPNKPKLPYRNNFFEANTNQHRNLPGEDDLYLEIDEESHSQNDKLTRQQKQSEEKGKVAFEIVKSCRVFWIGSNRHKHKE